MSTVGGRYEVLGIVAEGGEGSVARGRDLRDGSIVALKQLATDSAEGSVLADVAPHPALPRVREELVEDGRLVLVMDWIDGTDLGRILQMRGAPGLPALEVLSYLEQAAAALAHLHALEPPVIHGDVKPANLIVDDAGRVHLVDFGVTARSQAASARLGTRGFVAPEVASGGALSVASDVYGLAATTVALLTGAPPGEGTADLAAVPRRARVTLEPILRRALSLDPASRPLSTGALVDSVSAVVHEWLPSGEVTCVAFAIHDEEQLWATNAELMPRVVKQFDSLMREIAERNDGVLASATNPDGGFAVFAQDERAHDAAADISRAVADEPWPAGLTLGVRVAVHSGTAAVSSRGYEGPAVDQCREQLRRIAATRTARSSSGALLGRDAELGPLMELVADTVRGRGALSVVSGDAGIGKTRLLEEMAVGATRDGLTVLWGIGHEAGAPAYWPWLQVLRSYVSRREDDTLRAELGAGAAVLAEVVPEIRQHLPDLGTVAHVEPETARFRLFDVIGRVLASATRSTPLLIVLDDLHWADRSTMLLLQFLLPTIGESRLVVVAAHRPTELIGDEGAASLVADLEGKAAVAIRLAGLEDRHVAAHANRVVGGELPPAVLQAITRHAAGNPLFAAELARLLATEVDEDGNVALEIPDTVRAVVSRRVERLGASCAALLAAASVLGQEFDADLLLATAGTDPGDLERDLARATDGGVVTPTDTSRLRFSHPLIRETLYDGIPGARRAALHRRAGEALRSVVGDSDERIDELAYHFTEGVWGSDVGPAMHYARRAAERAEARYAFDEAAGWFRRAIEVLDLGESTDLRTRAELLCGLGIAQRDAGDVAHRETLLGAAHLADRIHDTTLLGRAALENSRSYFSMAGAVDHERVAVLEAAIAALEAQPEQAGLRASLMAMRAAELAFTVDFEQRVAMTSEAVDLARSAGDQLTLARVLLFSAVALHAPDGRTLHHALSAEAAELSTGLDDPSLDFATHLAHGACLMQSCDLRGFDACLDRMGEIVARFPQPSLRWIQGWSRAARAFLAGDLDEAERLATGALDLGSASSQPDALGMYGVQLLCIRWAQGRLDEIVDLLASAAEQMPVASLRTSLALALLEAGRDEEAERLVTDLARDNFEALGSEPTTLMALMSSAEVAARLGMRDAAVALRSRFAPIAGRFDWSAASTCGAVDHYLGRLAFALGDLDGALAHLDRAAELHARLEAPFFVALTDLERARTLLARNADGDAERAAELLTTIREAARQGGFSAIERQAATLAG